MAGAVLNETGLMDWTTSIIQKKWVACKGSQSWRGTARLRFYPCHELVRMLRVAGFRRISAHGSFTGGPLTLDHQWQLLVAQKPKA